MFSKTGRKIRKDSFEAQHDMNAVNELLIDLYLKRHLSTNEIPMVLEREYNIKISHPKCFILIKRLGILRNKSEAVSLYSAKPDYNKSHLTESTKNIVDGLILANADIYPNHNLKVARLGVEDNHKEFIDYCGKLIVFYLPTEPSLKNNSNNVWQIITKDHPDLYKHYHRWYLDNGEKHIPEDFILSPDTFLLWYLANGHFSSSVRNSVALYLTLPIFQKDALEIIVNKLRDKDIEILRVKDNHIYISSSSIPKMLQYIGGKSPVKCYLEKFNMDNWRNLKSLKEVCIELNIDYQRVANWVKTNFVRHSRSPGGKRVVFSHNEFLELKTRIESGELPRDKSKRAKTRFITKENLLTYEFVQEPDEDFDHFIYRIIQKYYTYGFPYKIWTEERLVKKWNFLKKVKYALPDVDVVDWRQDGLSFADYFHPHIHDLNSKGKIAPLKAFLNEDLFKRCLLRHKERGGHFTYAGVYNALCRDAKSKRVNNFSPLIARSIYDHYCKDGFKVLDPCAGFSGRLIGSSLCKYDIEYYGIEPSDKTYYGLVETQKFIAKVFPQFKSYIVKDCAEDILTQYKDNYFDFCFTSPPYFDLEHYAIDSRQSYIRYPEYDLWLNGFLRRLLVHVYKVIKVGCYCVLNIGKAEKYDIPNDCIKIANDIGFKTEQVKHISFRQYPFVDAENRLEPLIIFKKDG